MAPGSALQKYPALILDWFNTNDGSEVEKRDLTISLLNQNHEPILTWKLQNAFPVKLSGPVLNACSSEVAMETLELAHERLIIETFRMFRNMV